jgi:hypothetical protein
MIVKVRVWPGRATLATEQGKLVHNFSEFEAWSQKQEDGDLEVWAGRWWKLGKEARPFKITAGACFCAHPSYQSKKGVDGHEYSGFFLYEAWNKAISLSETWEGLGVFARIAAEGTK